MYICRPVSESAESNRLLILRTYTSFGKQSFGTPGPAAWNDMPASMSRSDRSLNDFRHSLKTVLFRELQYDVAALAFATVFFC